MCLSEAIERGWFLVDQEMMLGDLVGVFAAPSSIPVAGRIMIGVGTSLDTKSVGLDQFLFTDIEITVVEEA